MYKAQTVQEKPWKSYIAANCWFMKWDASVVFVWQVCAMPVSVHKIWHVHTCTKCVHMPYTCIKQNTVYYSQGKHR